MVASRISFWLTCWYGLQAAAQAFQWGQWTTTCSVSCGSGLQLRIRDCLNDDALKVSSDKCTGTGIEAGSCNLGACQDTFTWGSWTKTCSVTCGDGAEMRIRECFDAIKKKVSSDKCNGTSIESGKCSLKECQAYHWGPWTTTCSVTCGDGFEMRVRECFDGNDVKVSSDKCQGAAIESGSCSPGQCQAYHWSEWKSSCSSTCGVGTEYKTRQCMNEFDSVVSDSNCAGNSTDASLCRLPPCDTLDGYDWGQWDPWSPCRVGFMQKSPCAGARWRSRSCTRRLGGQIQYAAYHLCPFNGGIDDLMEEECPPPGC